MKNIFLMILLLIPIICHSQDEPIFIHLDDTSFAIKKDSNNLGGYECVLTIKGLKDIDSYNFRIVLDNTKTFDENGVVISQPNLMSIESLKKMPACDLHVKFSYNQVVYLVKKDIVSGIFKRWIAMYVGTSKNLFIN